MKQKVKKLRVQIDGLGRLCKGLNHGMRVNLSLRREEESMEDFVKRAGEEKLGVSLGESSKQTEKATDSLFLAKAWLGKVLGALGTESPYPKDGTRKTIKDIEPTADQASKDGGINFYNKNMTEGFSHIEKVDWLRQEISKIINDVQPLWNIESLNIWGVAAVENCFTHLSEARFHLGFELERIRENENN